MNLSQTDLHSPWSLQDPLATQLAISNMDLACLSIDLLTLRTLRLGSKFQFQTVEFQRMRNVSILGRTTDPKKQVYPTFWACVEHFYKTPLTKVYMQLIPLFHPLK